MPHLASYLELLAQVRHLHPGSIVAIEGFMSSGKSYLANAIGAELGCAIIHTDDYVAPGDESLPYVDRLNCNDLNASLAYSLGLQKIVAIEGICLRHVLARIRITSSLFIYVKRMAPNGLWHDGHHLEDYEQDKASVNQEPELSDLHYHSVERPHECARYVFHRVESQNGLQPFLLGLPTKSSN